MGASVPSVGIDAAAATTRVRHRRPSRVTTGLISIGAVLVLAASACSSGLPTTTDPTPAAPAASSAGAVDHTPTPEPTPRPTAAPAPAPEPSVAEVPVFRTGARVGDFSSNAPEADVVAYLTAALAMEPELAHPDYACPPGAVPGRILTWPGTGVGLRVRTTDDAGNAVDPYVAAWTLMEPSATLGLATGAGLRAGDTQDRVLELYPDASYGESELGGAQEWWYSAADEGGTLLAIGTDDGSVHRIESGYGCGE